MRRLTLAFVVATAVAGTALAADRGPATNPPPPVEPQPYAYKQWAEAYVRQGEFRLSGFTDDRALLFDPATVVVDGRTLNAIVRGELFRSERIQGVTQRSFRDRWGFDCTDRKVKVLFSEAHSQSNLQGRAETLDVSKEDWQAVAGEDGEAQLLALVCSMGSLLQSGIDRAKAIPPDLHDVTDEATAAWMREHVDAGGDVMILAENGLGIFYSPSGVGKAASGRPQLWLRTELSVLLPADRSMWRSMRDLVEVDCLNTRFLRSKQEVYPGSNLLGAKTDEALEPTWTDAVAGGTDARWVGALCEKLSNVAKAQPPAPANKSTAAISDWIQTYINTNHYLVAADIGLGVALYSTSDLEALDDGHLVTNVRVEQYQPAGANDFRSMVQKVEIDCKGSRQRILSATGYARSNLEGETFEVETSDWTKVAPGTNGDVIGRQVCSQASLAGDIAPVAMPSPLRGSTPAETQEWIDAHLVPDGYEVSDYSDDAVAMFSRKEMEPTRQGYVRAHVRMEFFKPQVTDNKVQRSMRTLMEFDCDQHRSRTLANETFAGSNLIGDKVEDKPANPDWSFISPNTLLSNVANDVCQVKEENEEKAADPPRPQPSGQKL
jgi:hypothetical protein